MYSFSFYFITEFLPNKSANFLQIPKTENKSFPMICPIWTSNMEFRWAPQRRVKNSNSTLYSVRYVHRKCFLNKFVVDFLPVNILNEIQNSMVMVERIVEKKWFLSIKKYKNTLRNKKVFTNFNSALTIN